MIAHDAMAGLLSGPFYGLWSHRHAALFVSFFRGVNKFSMHDGVTTKAQAIHQHAVATKARALYMQPTTATRARTMDELSKLLLSTELRCSLTVHCQPRRLFEHCQQIVLRSGTLSAVLPRDAPRRRRCSGLNIAVPLSLGLPPLAGKAGKSAHIRSTPNGCYATGQKP